jgi:hypothetical protein
MAKQFIIYYKKGTGTYIITEPRPWARENQQYFPGYDFTPANHPTSDTIKNYLIENFNFKENLENNQEVQLIYNLDPNLEL